MRLTIESPKSVWVAGDEVIVRVIALNDSFEPVDLDRGLVIGPNGFSASAGRPFPVAVEPPDPSSVVRLQPYTAYARERRYTNLLPGRYTFHAYLLGQMSSALLTEGPADQTLLDQAAQPLTLHVVEHPIIINLSVALT